MSKKSKIITYIRIAFLVLGTIFLVLCIATNINDALFLPLALGCIIVVNILQIIDYKNKDNK